MVRKLHTDIKKKKKGDQPTLQTNFSGHLLSHKQK